jgi:hypothetical protein
MDQQNAVPPSAHGCLSRIGLACVVSLGALWLLGVATVLPPWVKVKCQRRQVLYWSEQVKIYEQEFAGYDLLTSKSKWQTIGPATSPSSETYFDVTEYRVYWPLLAAEWAVICLAAIGVFVWLSRRLSASRPPSGSQEGPGHGQRGGPDRGLPVGK